MTTRGAVVLILLAVLALAVESINVHTGTITATDWNTDECLIGNGEIIVSPGSSPSTAFAWYHAGDVSTSGFTVEAVVDSILPAWGEGGYVIAVQGHGSGHSVSGDSAFNFWSGSTRAAAHEITRITASNCRAGFRVHRSSSSLSLYETNACSLLHNNQYALRWSFTPPDQWTWQIDTHGVERRTATPTDITLTDAYVGVASRQNTATAGDLSAIQIIRQFNVTAYPCQIDSSVCPVCFHCDPVDFENTDANGCVATTGIPSCPSDLACGYHYCDQGVCTGARAGLACDDGDATTCDDTCVSGFCTGATCSSESPAPSFVSTPAFIGTMIGGGVFILALAGFTIFVVRRRANLDLAAVDKPGARVIKAGFTPDSQTGAKVSGAKTAAGSRGGGRGSVSRSGDAPRARQGSKAKSAAAGASGAGGRRHSKQQQQQRGRSGTSNSAGRRRGSSSAAKRRRSSSQVNQHDPGAWASTPIRDLGSDMRSAAVSVNSEQSPYLPDMP